MELPTELKAEVIKEEMSRRGKLGGKKLQEMRTAEEKSAHGRLMARKKKEKQALQQIYQEG